MAATSTLKPEQVRVDGYLHNLGPDYVAVDDRGFIIARSSKETIERDHPNAHHFTGKDFDKSLVAPDPIVNDAQPAVDIPGVPQTPSGLPVADALADDPTPEPDTRTHPLDDGTPFEGPQALDPTNIALNKIAAQSGTPIKDALQASATANTDAENAGRHAKVDELQAAQVEVLEDKGVIGGDKTKTENVEKNDKRKDPFDHDESGSSGGSRPGKDSTASRGKAARDARK